MRFADKSLEAIMLDAQCRGEAVATIRTDLGAIFATLELSRSKWLVTSLSPGDGERMSRHQVAAGDLVGLLALLRRLQEKAKARTGQLFPLVTMYEAGLDGFWLHRALEKEGVESHVVDPASIAMPRRARRAKTDRLDGESMLRALLAYKRGEPRVCSMVRVPTPEQEDDRRLSRERRTLTAQRVEIVNRIKGLLCSQGVFDYQPLLRNRRKRLEALETGDGRPLGTHLRALISRELDRLELLLEQIRQIEVERDALLEVAAKDRPADAPPAPVAMLLGLVGLGPEFTSVLWHEGLFRHFDNRRQLAAYAGLAATPWKSGKIDREQGISKAGNPRLRTTLIQLAWLWLRHQPDAELSKWFRKRAADNGGRSRHTFIVALARKLLVALWKYVTQGVIIEGAILNKAAE
jgi:transposase